GGGMTVPLLLTFTMLCALLLLQGMTRRGAMYQYPFLAGAVFTGFALPQLIGLTQDPFLPLGALNATLFMACLSAAMCWIGAAAVREPANVAYWEYDDKLLLAASAGLSLLGAYFYYAITQLPPELTQTSMWTGLPVAYFFLARMMGYGFAIAVLLVARG